MLAACGSSPTAVPPEDAGAAALGYLGAGRTDLAYASTHHSPTGDHVRFQRLASDGTPIADVTLSVHLGRDGNTRIVDDHPGAFRLVGARTISDAEARAAARAVVRDGEIEDIALAHVAIPHGDDTVHPGFRATVSTRHPTHAWDVLVDGDGVATLGRDRDWRATGTGYVYDPNPLAQTGDFANMHDNSGATSPALDAARIQVTLADLDGSGVLRGTWVDAHPKSVVARATSPTATFLYDRASLQFDETMVYYHLDRVQTQLQALGFTDANARVQTAIVDGETADNSMYSESDKAIHYGTGGVDDAQDADVIVHEYGHAVQDNIVPGWGGGDEGAMGEGFGDLLAASTEPIDPVAHPMVVTRKCLATWDATEYDTSTPPCLRRVDGTKHYPEATMGEVHADGEIFSAANEDLYTALGDPALGLKLVIESFYSLNTTATFQKWVDALVAADTALAAGAHVLAIRKVMWARGLDRRPLPPSTIGMTTTVAVSLGPIGAIPNNADASVTIHQDGAAAIQLHYSTFNLQTSNSCLAKHCDNVYVFDGQGRLFEISGGNLGAHASAIVPGDTVVVRWVTNASGVSAGFHIDSYDWSDTTPPRPVDAPPDAFVAPPDAAPPDAAPDAMVDAPDALVIDATPALPDAPVNHEVPDAGGVGHADGGCCDTRRAPTSGTLVFGLMVFGHVVRRRRSPTRSSTAYRP